MTYRKQQRLLILIVALLALNFGCEWASYYATSGPLNGRSQIVPLFMTLAGLVAGVSDV